MARKQKKTPEQRLKDHKSFMKVMLWIAGGILVTTWGWYFWHFPHGVSDDQQVWGVFGDFVGGVLNPFFALLALFALLYTIVLQVEEMQDMRTEFAKTVEEAKVQTFENMFFQMLRLHHEIVGTIIVRDEEEVIDMDTKIVQRRAIHTSGRLAFERYCELFDDNLDVRDSAIVNVPDNEVYLAELTHIRDTWEYFWASHHTELGHYFRNLYNIVKLVADTPAAKDKKRYIRLIRAQLSAYELKMIFYNCLRLENEPFKKYIEEYAIFEQIQTASVVRRRQSIVPNEHYGYYESGAYGTWTPPPTAYDAVSEAIDSISTAPEPQSSE